MSQSNRMYYRELPDNQALIVHHDLCLFNTMVHDAYDKLYKIKFNNLKIDSLSQYLKEKYDVNDYMPLSAIWKAKAVLASNIETHKNRIKNTKNRIHRIDKKINETSKKLKQVQNIKQSIIAMDKARLKHTQIPSFKNYKGSCITWNSENPFAFSYKGITYSLYLFEVQIVDPEIKRLKHRIKMLEERKKVETQKLQALEKRVSTVCFGGKKLMKAQFTNEEYLQDHEAWKKDFHHARNHEMAITGRRQGKYSNNLFKYHIDENLLYYYASDKTIVKLPVEFHLHRDLLLEKVRLPHNTEGKAVCYTLEDHGDYFILKAMMELPVNVEDFNFFTSNGVIGIDVNANHIALAETDEHGNLIGTKKIDMKLKRKTSKQRKHIMREVAKQVFDICEKAHKPLIIERLNLTNKKKEMMYNNKRYNQMLSEFAYAQIKESLYSRSYKTKIGIKEVNPAYTSQIGRWKYMWRKGISVHIAAAYTIARRGQKFKEKLITEYRIFLSIEDQKKHHWSQWNKLNKLAKCHKDHIIQRNPIEAICFA